jgi:hypothetical protein
MLTQQAFLVCWYRNQLMCDRQNSSEISLELRVVWSLSRYFYAAKEVSVPITVLEAKYVGEPVSIIVY